MSDAVLGPGAKGDPDRPELNEAQLDADKAAPSKPTVGLPTEPKEKD